jgi:hypothetical protein
VGLIAGFPELLDGLAAGLLAFFAATWTFR